MNRNKKKTAQFQYFAEDADCKYCLYHKGAKRGCSLTACCCEDIKSDAAANGRLKRKRGWNK